jgi:pilus assembly protein CpaE
MTAELEPRHEADAAADGSRMGTLRVMLAFDGAIDRGLVGELMWAHPTKLTVLDSIEIADSQAGEDGRGDVLVVACAEYSNSVREFIAMVTHMHPARPTVLVCSAAGNGYVGHAFSAGADDIVTLPRDPSHATLEAASNQLLFALEKTVARKNGLSVSRSATKLGRMIAVLGLKGGSGKTLTVANLAAALAAAGQRVAVVDLDLQFGDIGLALGLRPERTLYDLLLAGGSLDAQKVEDFMVVHESGVRALLAPTRPDQGGLITADFLREVYPLLREMHDFVLLDTPPSFTPEVIAAVDAARDVCVVSMLDALSLKNSRIGLETLQRLDYTGRVRLVLNRADTNVGISRSDVVEIIGRAPDVLVPSDRNVTRAMNRGEPIVLSARRSDAARAFNALAAMYITDPETGGHVSRPRRRLFGRGA